mmetsp:Transcript_43194/g.69247  ORF Transcript_43194/g.69247 Transcript_43194/m.69247 type:complete len:615 (+) Transcript_43194:78-1922(+)
MNIFNFKFYKTLKRRLSNSNHSEQELDDAQPPLHAPFTASSPRHSQSQLSLHTDQQAHDETTAVLHDENYDDNLQARHQDEQQHVHEDSEILPLDSDQSETDDDDDAVDTEDSSQRRTLPGHGHQSPICAEEKQNATEPDQDLALFYAASASRHRREQQQQQHRLFGLNAHHISIETITKPNTYHISWLIDEESLNFAFLRNRKKSAMHTNHNNSSSSNDNACKRNVGILEAEMVKNGIAFKLELCISGWKNSNRGFCAFYLTIPQQRARRHAQQEEKEREPDLDLAVDAEPLVARYTVCVMDANHSKQSSIRDDFHLGVGFPNFCSEHLLFEARQKHHQKKLALQVKIEIFCNKSCVKGIEQVVYERFVSEFDVNTANQHKMACRANEAQLNVEQADVEEEQKEWHNNNQIQTRLLSKMYTDGVYSDVRIKCLTRSGQSKSIQVHKCVLIHSSLVFQKMFDVNASSPHCVGFLESQHNEINLEHSLWRYHIIRHMVKFLYFGEICVEFAQRIEDLFELFCIAEYFQIEALITECCHQFVVSLSPNNVCFLLLKFANHNYQYQHIKQVQFLMRHNVLWRYMLKHIKKVQQTAYYKQILHQHPFVLNQFIEKIIQ